MTRISCARARRPDDDTSDDRGYGTCGGGWWWRCCSGSRWPTCRSRWCWCRRCASPAGSGCCSLWPCRWSVWCAWPLHRAALRGLRHGDELDGHPGLAGRPRARPAGPLLHDLPQWTGGHCGQRLGSDLSARRLGLFRGRSRCGDLRAGRPVGRGTGPALGRRCAAGPGRTVGQAGVAAARGRVGGVGGRGHALQVGDRFVFATARRSPPTASSMRGTAAVDTSSMTGEARPGRGRSGRPRHRRHGGAGWSAGGPGAAVGADTQLARLVALVDRPRRRRPPPSGWPTGSASSSYPR